MTIRDAILTIESSQSLLNPYAGDRSYEETRNTVLRELRKISEVLPRREYSELNEYVARFVRQVSEKPDYKNMRELSDAVTEWQYAMERIQVGKTKSNSNFRQKIMPALIGAIVSVILLVVGLILALVVFKEDGQKTTITFFIIESLKDVLAGFGTSSVCKVGKGKPTGFSLVIGYVCGVVPILAMIIVLLLLRFSVAFSTIAMGNFLWLGITMLAVAIVGLVIVARYYSNRNASDVEVNEKQI